METLKKFLKSKQARRFYWTVLNGLMGLAISFLTLIAVKNITVATIVLPVATALSQTLTKYLNTKYG